MEQTILTEPQKKLLRAVAHEPHLKDFYLSGGTALTVYYFQHRLSDDLDFFTFEEPDTMFLRGFAEKLKTILNAESFTFERLYDRNIIFFTMGHSGLKIEFTKYPFPQLEKPFVTDGMPIDSLRDIAANKLVTLLDRFDPKDFVDVFFLLQKYTLENIKKDAEKKFDCRIDDVVLGGALAKVKRIEALPAMLKIVTTQELKDFFTATAKTLEPKVVE